MGNNGRTERKGIHTDMSSLSKINDGDVVMVKRIMKHETFTENLVYIRYQSKHFKLASFNSQNASKS